MNTFGMTYNKRKHCYEPIYIEKSAKERQQIATIISRHDEELKNNVKLTTQKVIVYIVTCFCRSAVNVIVKCNQNHCNISRKSEYIIINKLSFI